MESGFLKALTVAFLAASLIAAFMHRLRQSTIIGYLLSGVLIGPSVLGLVGESQDVQNLAEVGVIMLMFTLGVEFSVAQLRRLKRPAALGGTIQLWGTMLATTMISWLVYRDWYKGFFAGCVLAMSSTVIVLKLLEETGGSHTPHGTAALGVSIYQDVLVVPLMLLLSAFGGDSAHPMLSLTHSLGKAAVFLGASWFASKIVAGWFLDAIARTRSKELFTISAVAVCLGIALLAQSLGLSLALGAFVAGLMVSSSIYSHKILSDILPFRDCFLSLFFISVGMLVDVRWVALHLGEVLAWGSIGLVLKLTICSVACLACGFSIRSSLLAGFCLAEVGEFSFVLLSQGLHQQTLSPDRYQLFLAVILFTLIVVPALWKPFQKFAAWTAQRPLLQEWEIQRYAAEHHVQGEKIHDHVILIGCGPFGQVVLHSVHLHGGRCMVLDLNSQTVKHLQKAGYDAIYGEAGNLKILDSLQLETAMAVVMTIPDLQGAEAMVREARLRRPDILILARARFSTQIEPLRRAGANQVIYEEMEGASQMAKALEKHLKDSCSWVGK